MSPDMTVSEPSPTADLKSVSNLDWSWAVMKDSRMLGILLEEDFGRLPAGFGVPPVWKDAAIWLKPVACGLIGAGDGAEVCCGCCC